MMTTLACNFRYARRADLGRLRRSQFEYASLGELERQELARLSDDDRRETWLAGRLLAKRLILKEVFTKAVDEKPPSLHEIDISSRDRGCLGTRPRVFYKGQRQPISLSISHSDIAICVAMSSNPRVRVGVDLTLIGAPGRGFVGMWFTPIERCWLRENDPGQVSRFWAIKEAIYKACNSGEGFSPRRVEVMLRRGDKLTCRYRNKVLDGCCAIRHWEVDRQVVALVTVESEVIGEFESHGHLAVQQDPLDDLWRGSEPRPTINNY